MKVFFVTCSEQEAEGIAGELVEKKLAACVNILTGVKSIYEWEGKVQNDTETLLVIKTARRDVQSFIEEVKKLHSYDVPEVIGFEITDASPDYLKWVIENSDEE